MESQEPKMVSQQPQITSQEPKMASHEEPVTNTLPLSLFSKYSKRVVLKTILERSDGGVGLVGERLVIGGWVKSSKEVRKEPVPTPQPSPQANDGPTVSPGPKDGSCVEIIQSRIPLFRSIMKILGGGSGGAGGNYPIREKMESLTSRPPPPPPPPASIVYLLVSDGSCVASLQVH